MTRSTGDQRDEAGVAAAESGARKAVTWLPSRPDTSGWFDRTECFRVGGVEFHCSFESGSTVDRFFICKHRPLVEEYLDLFAGFTDANIVELGISEGGSSAMTALVADPKKLVAIELNESRIDALDELIERAARRNASGEWSAAPMTRAHFEQWATIFQPPDDDELRLFDQPITEA